MDALLDFDWIYATLNETDIDSVCAAFEQLPDVDAARLIHDALRLSAHVLTNHKDQLRTQLCGRLAGVEIAGIATLLAHVSEHADSAWLKPVLTTMPRVG